MAGAGFQPGPSSGVLLPSLELRHADGQLAPLWDYRGRGPLLVFLHEAPACQECLTLARTLAAAHRGYREIGAWVLAVGREPLVDVPYPALVDTGGRLAAALQDRGVLGERALPALLVVGRTGAIWAAWSGSHAALPASAEIDDWLEYSLSECRECFCCELVWPAELARAE